MKQYGDRHLMLGACCNLEITPALSLALHHSDDLLFRIGSLIYFVIIFCLFVVKCGCNKFGFARMTPKKNSSWDFLFNLYKLLLTGTISGVNLL